MSIKTRLEKLEKETGKNASGRIIVLHRFNYGVSGADKETDKASGQHKKYWKFMDLEEEKQGQTWDYFIEEERNRSNGDILYIVEIKADGLNVNNRLIGWDEVEPVYSLLKERDVFKKETD